MCSHTGPCALYAREIGNPVLSWEVHAVRGDAAQIPPTGDHMRYLDLSCGPYSARPALLWTMRPR
eukprot:5887403-Pyramimonas_sp.AAC.1